MPNVDLASLSLIMIEKLFLFALALVVPIIAALFVLAVAERRSLLDVVLEFTRFIIFAFRD